MTQRKLGHRSTSKRTIGQHIRNVLAYISREQVGATLTHMHLLAGNAYVCAWTMQPHWIGFYLWSITTCVVLMQPKIARAHFLVIMAGVLAIILVHAAAAWWEVRGQWVAQIGFPFPLSRSITGSVGTSMGRSYFFDAGDAWRWSWGYYFWLGVCGAVAVLAKRHLTHVRLPTLWARAGLALLAVTLVAWEHWCIARWLDYTF